MRAADWSLGGLRIDNFEGTLPRVGAELSLNLTLPFQGFDVSYTATAEVVRVFPANKSVAVQFIELGERERELMQHFIEELVRGSMSDVEDTIQRIDVPVTPASLEPDNKPIDLNVPVRRMPTKTLVMTGAYLVLGMFIFGYAGVLAYANFFRMEIQTAVITAPVESIESVVDGRITWANYAPGDAVRAGDVLINMVDNELEREIELADIAVKERQAKLVFLKRRHADELERIRGFATIEMKNVKQTRLDVEASAAQLEAARANFKRISQLYKKGYATDEKYQDTMQRMVTLEKQLERRQIELSSRIELAQQDLGKRLYTGDDLIGKAEQLQDEVHLAKHEVKLARERHVAIARMRARNAIRAPFDGTILSLPRVDNASVRRGDVVAIVEQRRQREVTAFLNQNEVLKVGQGDDALIYIPALSETLEGTVVKIDRTSGFIREQDQRQNPGYAWRGPKDRTARVIIRFKNPDLLANYDVYRSGLPVVVVFEQRSTNSLFSSIRQKLALTL